MAYINGEWLDRPEREERIKLLRKKLKTVAELIKLGKATDYHFDIMERDKAELEKCLIVHRAEVDHLFFFYFFFSENMNEGNPDNLVPDLDYTMEDAPEFHQRLSKILDSVSNVNTTANVCWSASRGHAKSAYLSNSFPVRELCYRKRRMILIISESQAGSLKFVKWCANQLKFNSKIREYYGPLLEEQSNRNVKDAQDQFVTHTGAMMASGSLGKQIRGIRNGSVNVG